MKEPVSEFAQPILSQDNLMHQVLPLKHNSVNLIMDQELLLTKDFHQDLKKNWMIEIKFLLVLKLIVMLLEMIKYSLVPLERNSEWFVPEIVLLKILEL